MQYNFYHHAQFFTATIRNWIHVLRSDDRKRIITDSLHHLTAEGCITVYGFVIMPNHIHLIWQVKDGYVRAQIYQRFLKYTAQQLKFRLIDEEDSSLKRFLVNQSDRKYQFWQKRSLGIDVWSEPVIKQKLLYIHNNPLQDHWKLARHAEEYWFSSARFYYTGEDNFGFLTHYKG